MKDKRNIVIIIGIIAFIVILGGISFSYFVYNKNLGDVSVNTGEISINYSDVNGNMSLTGIVPKTDNEGKISTDYIDFTVDGIVDTDKIYYELSIVPNSGNTLDTQYIKVYLTDQEDNIIKGVTLYNSLQLSENETGKRIYRETIDPNQDGTKKTYTKDFRLRVWLDESYSEQTTKTFEFNVNLFAKNVDNDYEIREGNRIIAKNAIIPTNPINFAKASSSSNGEGLYILPGTENEANPIYYYRGAVDNNNVIFGGYCWQMLRTTETGGIKMIYNGLPDIEGSGENITYKCGPRRNIQDDIMSTTSLSQSTGYFYADDYEIVSSSVNGATYRLKSATNPITRVAIANASEASTKIPAIVENYPYTCKRTTSDGTCTILYKVDSYASGTNANVYASTDISTIGRSMFNSSDSSVSDVGYMSNTRYINYYTGWTANALFASSAIWVTDHYELVDASVTAPDDTHHYSCNMTTSSASCTSVRYVSSQHNTTLYYITLTNGELIEDALYKMTGNGSSQTKKNNSTYALNQNNSIIKSLIDTWFETNLTNVVDNTKIDYRLYLEDTVFCNDRSFKTESGSIETYLESGWNPNVSGTSGNGNLTKSLFFGSINRVFNDWYSTTNVPSVVCPNELDKFTVSSSNGNGKLTYPVGLITADEIVMAGTSGNSNGTDIAHYLYTGDNYWSMSPYCFGLAGDAIGLRVYTGYIDTNYVNNSNGVRPVVSLKPGIEFELGGDGTPTNPYVVKYD